MLVAFLLFMLAIPCYAQDQAEQGTIDGLIYNLKNPDPDRRKEAAKMLGNKRIREAIPELIAASGDADAGVRLEIINALDKMQDMRSLPAFVDLSSDREKDIREKCLQSMVILYLPRESGIKVTLSKVAYFLNPWSDEWGDLVVEPGISVDASVVNALRSRLYDSDVGIREKAAQALGILKARDAIPAMLECLQQEKSESVLFELVRSLRKIGDPSAAKSLTPFVDYYDFSVRNEAVLAVGRLRYRETVPKLMQLYEKEAALPPRLIDEKYRVFLLEALAFIGDPLARELFIGEMKNADETLRLHAFEGLARIGDSSIVTEISRNRLHEANAKIQTAQAYALYRMGRKEYIDEIVKALGSEKTNYEAKQYLVELRREELPELYAQIANRDVGVRESLAEIFGLIGDSSAIAPLQELSEDSRGNISALANQSIRWIYARNEY